MTRFLRPAVPVFALAASAVVFLAGCSSHAETNAGMLGVTLFGLFLTPVFYVALRKLVTRDAAPAADAPLAVAEA